MKQPADKERVGGSARERPLPVAEEYQNDFPPPRSGQRPQPGSGDDYRAWGTYNRNNPNHSRNSAAFPEDAYGLPAEDQGFVTPSTAGRGFRGRGPSGYQLSDERLHERICELLTEHEEIDPSDVTVEVNDQAVKLSGTVGNRWMKYQIEELLDSSFSLRDLDNQLRVQRSGRN